MIKFGISGMFVIALGLLGGCGRPLDCPDLNRLRVGHSTIPEAVALLGEPCQRMPGAHGSSMLEWESSTHSYVGGGTVTRLRLTFQPEGTLLAKACDTVIYPPLVQEPAGR